MGIENDRDNGTPGQRIRSVMDLCADCDTCRTLMEGECLFFPELYRLWDREKEEGTAITDGELRGLTNLCTLCGLCPCPKVPADIMKAKSGYVGEEGLSLAVRLVNDIPLTARVCGTFPRLTRALQKSAVLAPLFKKVAGVHPERQLPEVPAESFFRWAAAKGLSERKGGSRNVAYFAGCTAGYLFPEVARATVEVLEANGAAVYVPPQQCCGMPHLVEGDRAGALKRSGSNLDSLRAAIEAGDELVTSCSTCGYLMKVLLKERAYYAPEYQRWVNAGEDEIKTPNPSQGPNRFLVMKKSVYRNILKDDGYFSPLPALPRIELAERLLDAGEYLARLQTEGGLAPRFAPTYKRLAYFAPCHQREQKMGRPYLDLLAQIPGLVVEPVGGESCCGMGGNFGFKADFHEKSLAVGKPLLTRIRELKPEGIVTDCLSCRLQFRHALPYPVFHPMEILAEAYRGSPVILSG